MRHPTLSDVRIRDIFRNYPLQYPISFDQDDSVIQLLIQEYPLPVQCKDRQNCYPLHFACQKKRSDAVVQQPIKEYPKEVRQKMFMDCIQYIVHHFITHQNR